MGERRRALRRKHFMRGRVYFDEGCGALDCLICDISDEGAHIILPEKANFPDVLELHVPQKERALRSRVQWRQGNEIGLAFLGARRSGRRANAEDSALSRSQFDTDNSLWRVLRWFKARVLRTSHQA
jgi:hypothetical protein